MDYEKKYKEVLENARQEYNTTENVERKQWLEELFLELAESEDEKIRRVIRGWIYTRPASFFDNGISKEEILTWLEKQGEKKPYGQREECLVCQFNYAGECKGFCAMKRDEQKPQRIISVEAKETVFDYENANIQQRDFAPKIKPKFKVGDWIVENGVNRNPVQIKSFEEDKGVGIKVWFSNGTGTYIDFLKGYHKWTIEDAKDGDVLAAHECIVLFKEIDGLNIKCHYTYHFMNNPSFYVNTLQNKSAFHPATKEQRDLLFQKMYEAGYIFDFDKKELKKVEQESTWNEKIKGLNELETYILSLVPDRSLDTIKVDAKNIRYIINKEQKSAWSEEDDK